MRCCPHCRRVWVEAHEHCPADGRALHGLGGADDPLTGWEIDGRYRLLSPLGAGGMGFVYLAEQVGLGRKVAVKMLYAERSRDQASVKRFAREARSLAALSHPGIVRVLDYAGGDHPFIAMELVQGPSLQRLIGGMGPLDPATAVGIARAVAAGLSAAHRAGVTHRDLKPGNIHLVAKTEGFEVRILDFGLAVLDEGRDSTTRLTKSGLVAGTPEYMAPEQIRNEPTDGRADLYALGVILYEMLAGEPPFIGESATAVVSKHLEDPAPLLPERGLDAEVQADLQRVLGRLLAKRPDDRYETAALLARDLGVLEVHLPPPASLSLVLAPSDPSAPTVDMQPPAERPGGRTSEAPWALTGNAAADRELEQMLSSSRRARRVQLSVAVLALGGLGLVGAPLLGVWSSPPPVVVSGEPSELAGDLGRRAAAPVPLALERRPIVDGGALRADDEDPRARVVTTQPGGEAQARYEGARRAFEGTLAARGLRFRDLRHHPRLRADWTAQDRAARELDFDAAAAALESLAASTTVISVDAILDARLRVTEARVASSAGDPVGLAAVRALRSAVPDASRDRTSVRSFLRRLDEVEGSLARAEVR
ncbi:MAG: serine/threonine protein kinase [Myxococcales bacterium]|nr:serine/threonine protein kinase [Myxococcales bacterium]